MILEGTHKDMGRGIFISDMQPDGIAAKVICRTLLMLKFTTLDKIFMYILHL